MSAPAPPTPGTASPTDTLSLVRQWHNGIKISQVSHARAATIFRSRGRMLGLPVTILSILVGTSIFSSLATAQNRTLLFSSGVLSILAAILAGLQTYLDYPNLSARHHTAACDYGKLRREIEETLTRVTDPGQMSERLPSFRSKWDDLEGSAPEIPLRIYNKALLDLYPELARSRGIQGNR